MDQYHEYTAEELATNPSFVNWVRQTNPRDCNYWENWLRSHPEQAEVCQQAKTIVLAVHLIHQNDELPHPLVQQHIQELIDQAEASKQGHSIPPRFLGAVRWSVWKVAAAACLLIGASWLYVVSQLDEQHFANQTESTPLSQITRINSGLHPMTILLGDGSVVTLSPNSRVSYPRVFSPKQRVVHLEGEAFFDVTKNVAKPFFVLTDRSLTKVVGTSFRVRAFSRELAVNVFVRTGKVAVYPVTPRSEQPLIVGANRGVMLLPNQQVEVKAGQLKKETISRHDLVAAIQVGPSEITFDNQPISDVLLTLSRLYEVPIAFDRQVLNNCRITTSFAEETLSERLSSICRAINATYTVENDTITVSSHGCTAPH